MHILGVDYGLKRIGLAFTEGSLASPMGKLTVKSKTDAIEKVLRLAHEHEVGVIVVGLPRPDTIHAQEFGEKLSELSGLKVEFIDETMTSREALEKLKSTTAKKRKARLDSAAATLILATYLENEAYK